MIQPKNVCNIRNVIVSNTGKKVIVRTNRGRNKIDVAEGIICQTYPCVFLVQLEGESRDTVKTISFSYTDILTKEVEVDLV